jgi:pimeloyl-ACP methyl ester carboxylesterase
VWTEDLAKPDDPRTTVFDGVSRYTRVCTYERPGTLSVLDGELFSSRSDPVPMLRTAADLVAELHAMIQAANAPGPYVLVGHSLGGVIVWLFAPTYSNEVIGMVLVDALNEGLRTRLTAANWHAYDSFNSSPLGGID